MAIPTQITIAQKYIDIIKALNPNAAVDIVGLDWWIKSQVIGGVVAGIYADVYNYSLSIFPQNSAGELVDRHLATWNLPPRIGAFPSSGTIQNTQQSASPISIPVGTIFNYGTSGLSYASVAAVTIPANTTGSVSVQCSTDGPGTQLPTGALLTPNTPIPGLTTFTVLSMVDGSNVEDDAEAINRVLERIQNPAAGGTVGDYYRWAIYNTISTGITDALIIPNFTAPTIVGVFILAGGFDVDSILSQPTVPVNRTATTAQIIQVTNYIETQRPATDSYFISSVDTYMIPSDVINVQVTLANGLTLDDPVPGMGLTVLELISREIRRAVLLTPIGGHIEAGTGYLYASDIEQTLDNSLSANPLSTGQYATILLDRQVTLIGGSPNFPLPGNILSDGNLPYVYDVAYASLNISIF